MTSPDTGGDREKVVTKLTSTLRQDLKIRAALHGLSMQDAVEAGITAWR
ncbi:ParA family protein, partial [Streptomyces sp. WAC02707]